MRKYHFIAGLPRSGSTLLSAILNQNPRFSAGIRSPLEDLAHRIIRGSSDEFRTVMTDGKIEGMIKGMFESYYSDKDKEIIFDTNRGWMLRAPLIKKLFPKAKMILCVRDIVGILNSFEKLHRKNPLRMTRMYDEKLGMNVVARASTLMGEGGVVTAAYNAMIQYLTTDEAFILEYKDLAEKPEATMRKLYAYLGEDYFEHDFENVESSSEEYDMDLNTPGLHTTRKKVELIKESSVLPVGLIKQFTPEIPLEFWRNQ